MIIAERDVWTARVPQTTMQRRLPGLEDGDRAPNLPLPLSSFVGRGEAIAKVRRLLATSRLVTLTGPGGVGKTRLALEVAFAVQEERDDGACWVDLAPLVDSGLVAHSVARALELPDDPTRSTVASLNEYLQDKDLVLVLDNCEHLIAECADLAGELLRHSPRLTLLTTSRESLGIEGETVWPVPPLSLPCLEETPAGERLVRSEAGRLFLERARAVQPDLQLTEAVAQAAAEVCCRLEGIPLAIELAAVRVQVLPVPQIAAHLDNLFQLLSHGSRTALPRHQTIEAAIAWSYDLLTRPEQVLFERLAVLVDGFRLEDAEAVAGDRSGAEEILPGEVLELLSQLVLKSLVVVREGEPVRYGMLETIRRYAWQRLLASGELERIRGRHLAHYLDLAERAEVGLGGEDQVAWLRLLAAEQDNLRAALRWSEESEHPEAGLRLAAALAGFWLRAGRLSEGNGWLARALAACSEPEGVAAWGAVGPVRAKALYQAGRLAQQGGDYERALALARQSLALSRRLEDKRGMARALGLTGWITHAQGDRDGAGPLLEESLALARESGDERTLALALLFLGDLYLRQGALEPAARLLEESLELYQGIADRWGMALAYGALGEVARHEGNYPQAVARLQLSLVLYQELGSRSDIPYLLEALALAAVEQGQLRRAALLWGGASSARRAVGAPVYPSYQADYAATLEALDSALGEREFAIIRAEGQAMSLDEALALAAEMEIPPETRKAGPRAGTGAASASELRREEFGLTVREVEVLRLVATGLTDAQVGERLVISPRTVGKHLQSIYGKLYIHSRSAATRWALEHGLG